MKLGFALPQIDKLGFDEIEEQLKAVSAMGYQGVEYLINDPSKVDRERVSALLDKYKMEISGFRTGSIHFSEGVRFSSPDPDNRRRAVERLKEVCELAGYFKTNIMIGLLQGNLQEGEDLKTAEDYICECLRECSEYAGQFGVTIMFEPVNRFELNYHNKTGEMAAFVDRINEGLSNKVKLLLDVYHMHLEDPSIASAFILGMKDMGHVHFSDSNRQAPGAGSIDFVDCVKILMAMKYDGYVTVEVLPIPDLLTSASISMDYIKPIINTVAKNFN